MLMMEILLKFSSYRSALSALVAVHDVCNTEYPKDLKPNFKFLEEYDFGIGQIKNL